MNHRQIFEFRGFRGSPAVVSPRSWKRGRECRRKFRGGFPFPKGRGSQNGCFGGFGLEGGRPLRDDFRGSSAAGG